MIILVVSFMKRKGMAFFPFIFLQKDSGRLDKVLMNHERIHIRQQLETLIVPFYLIYLINYLYNIITTLEHETAYRNILFEREAYDHQHDQNYLKTRKFFGFLNYL